MGLRVYVYLGGFIETLRAIQETVWRFAETGRRFAETAG